MKKVPLILLTITSIVVTLNGQMISQIDFNKIKCEINDSSSNYYYPTLMKRFAKFDTTLNSEEIRYLYYGTVFINDYDPMQMEFELKNKEFLKYLKRNENQQALKLIMPYMEQDPANVKYNRFVADCFYAQGDSLQAMLYEMRWLKLMMNIEKSGDGKTPQTDYVVVRFSDERQLISHMGYKVSGRIGSVDGAPGAFSNYVDMFVINKKDQGIDTIYINAAWAYKFLRNRMELEQREKTKW